ncbi:MAG TPA: outer membrane lipoprotein carrier protein LolA [Polyangiales bacterium]
MIWSRASARCSVLSLVLCALAPAQGSAEDAGAAPPAKARSATPDAGTARAEAAAVDAASLLRAFAGMPGLEARFREEKHIALLARPLTSEGRLFFTHPGLLLRRVETPRPSEVIINSERVVLRDASGEQALDLRARKDLRPFVESLTWILAGNQKALDGVYAVTFEPERGKEPWQLTLKPKVEPLSRLIAHIRIRGSGYAVARIEVTETNGDSTLTTILEANPRRAFDATERAKLFGTGSTTTQAPVARPKP